MITHDENIKEDKILISRKTLQLTSPVVFVARVLETAGGEMTYKEAYYIVEKEYQEVFDKRRYSCYESFRVIKSRILQPDNRMQLKLF